MSKKIVTRAGTRFGRLTVLGESFLSQPLAYICLCDCGTEVRALGQNLRRGLTQSCGCLQKARARANVFKHGLSHTPEFNSWASLRARCANPRNAAYPEYGGRGITVCPAWSDFATFYRDMGPKPSPQHSLDRIDNNGPYSPENCRWATQSEQMRNTRVNHVLTCHGETRNLSAWAEVVGVPGATIRARLLRGWTVEHALHTPL